MQRALHDPDGLFS